MITVVRVVAILFAGVMTGLLFGDWLGPAFARAEMPLPGFVQFQQIIHYNYLKVLPAVSLVALLAPLAWLVVLFRSRQRSSGADRRVTAWPGSSYTEFRIVVGATLCIAIGFAITFIFNVPVNDLLETWDYSSPPANARELWQPWELAHVVRTPFWGLGFLLEIVAVAITARGVNPASRAGG
jgi:uncharacterized membrane protein